MDQRTDAELVALAQKGDRDAFGTLAERYGSVAERVAYRMLGRRDVSQETSQHSGRGAGYARGSRRGLRRRPG